MKKLITKDIVLIMVFIAPFITSIFSGCNTYQKQLNKFQLFANAYSGELAKLCVEKFPAKDSIGGVKVDSTKKANNIDYQGKIDSLKEKADALKQELSKAASNKDDPCSPVIIKYQQKLDELNDQITGLKNSYKKCKPDTIFKTQTVFRVDQAAVRVWQDRFTVARDSVNQLTVELADEQKTAGKRLKWIVILSGIVVAFGGLTLLKLTGRI